MAVMECGFGQHGSKRRAVEVHAPGKGKEGLAASSQFEGKK
jgi:hypothetical protein